jgi:putative colanic acid biosysnthesis UDP-glucose lipid carrier transferase
MYSNRKALHFARFISDIVLLVVSYNLALYLVKFDFQFVLKHQDVPAILFCLSVVWFYSSRITSLYDDFRTKDFSFELVPIMKNVITQAVASIIILFLLKDWDYSRSFVFLFSGFLFLSVAIQKYLYRKIFEELRRNGRNTRAMLIIGGGEVGINFYNSINDYKQAGYNILGVLDDKKVSYFGEKYLGTIDALNYVLSHNHVEEVVVALPNYASQRLEYVVNTCRNYATRVKIIPDYFKFLSEQYEVDKIDRYTIISLRKETVNELHWRLLKRGFDIAFTLMVFVFVFSWLLPLLTILQLILNPGPIFYKAIRWGRNGDSFYCYKFRSMKMAIAGSANTGVHHCTDKNDSRITGFGRLLRKLNLDELPQFINVLKGEMSIVGPRPHDELENIELKSKIKSYMLRHLVKPGITGWAQVNGFRGGTKDMNLMRKRTECDLWYLENWSFWLDIQIIFLTVWRMIKGDPNAY